MNHKKSMSGNKTIATAMGTDMILGRLSVADHSYVQGIHVEQAARRIASETRTSPEAVVPLYATGSVH